MPIPRSIEARRYYRVALQRLEDGELIFWKLQRYPAAIYLAGYAIECILNAVILANSPDSRHLGIVRTLFRGARAHNPMILYEHLRTSGSSPFPDAIRMDLTKVSTWSVDLRYNPSKGDAKEAREFLVRVRRIVEFAEQRLR